MPLYRCFKFYFASSSGPNFENLLSVIAVGALRKIQSGLPGLDCSRLLGSFLDLHLPAASELDDLQSKKDSRRCRSSPTSREAQQLLPQQSGYQSRGIHELLPRFAVLRHCFTPDSESCVRCAHPPRRRDDGHACVWEAASGNLPELLASAGPQESRSSDHRSHSERDGDSPVDSGSQPDIGGCSLIRSKDTSESGKS